MVSETFLSNLAQNCEQHLASPYQMSARPATPVGSTPEQEYCMSDIVVYFRSGMTQNMY